MSSPLTRTSEDEVPESVPERQSSLTPIDISSDSEDSDQWLLGEAQLSQAAAILEPRMGSRPLHEISSDPEDSDESLSAGADMEDEIPESLSDGADVEDELGIPESLSDGADVENEIPESLSDGADIEDEVPESLPEGQLSLTPIDFSSDPEDSDESLSDGADVEDEILESLSNGADMEDEIPESLSDGADVEDEVPPQSQNEPQPPRGRKRAASSPLPARPPPVSRTTNLSRIWQSLPVELVQRVLHELVTIHLWEIYSDPFYPWETLRQLNRQQRRRIDALYRQLLLPILYLERWVEFCPTDRPMERFLRVWRWDEDEAYDSTNDTITMYLLECDTDLDYEEDGHDMHPLKGWNKYVNSFPPGGLYVNPEPHYSFDMKMSYKRDLHGSRVLVAVKGKIPASRVPDVQDDSDDDSIRVNSSQLIGALIRGWKKSQTSGGTRNGRWFFPSFK